MPTPKQVAVCWDLTTLAVQIGTSLRLLQCSIHTGYGEQHMQSSTLRGNRPVETVPGAGEALAVVEGDVGAPVGLVKGLEVALGGVIDGAVPQLVAVIEHQQAARLEDAHHLRHRVLPGLPRQLVEEVDGGHLHTEVAVVSGGLWAMEFSGGGGVRACNECLLLAFTTSWRVSKLGE